MAKMSLGSPHQDIENVGPSENLDDHLKMFYGKDDKHIAPSQDR
jgi:hypothetical protein